MVRVHAAEAMAENDRLITRAAELPSLGGYVNYFPWDRDYRKNDLNSPYTSQKSAYHLDLVQPVFHWGALEASSRIAELREKMAKGDTAAAYQALAHEIRAKFLGLVIKKADLARVRVDQQMAEQQLKLAQERFDQGNMAQAELTATKLGVERARLNTDIYQDDFTAFKRVLDQRRYIGRKYGPRTRDGARRNARRSTAARPAAPRPGGPRGTPRDR